MSGSASCEPDGTPYIEVHHIIPLCEGGEDGVWNLSVLCAHHHRMAHFADDTSKKQIRNFLQKEVDKRVGRKGDREMAELEEYPKNGTLEEKVQWIRNINADSLLHSDKFGQTFAGPIDKFKKVQALLHRLNIPEVEEVAQMSRINFMDHIEGIRDKIVVINNPDLNPKDAGTIAEHSQSQFTQITNQMSEQLSPYLLLISPPPTQTESADLILIKEEATKTLEDVHDIHEQVMHAAENITSQAAHTGVAVKARGFDEEYKKHVSASKIWLCAAGVFGIILFATSLYFYRIELVPESEGFAWNYFVPRFSILGILIFLEIILIGIYRAERHNAIVNKHRANALNTFETMSSVSLSPDVNIAVTLSAAGAIYAPQDSGYAKRGTSQQLNVAEMLAAIVETRK